MLLKPDWAYWANMPHAPVWQAVAISLNVCPKQRNPHAFYEEFRKAANLERLAQGTMLRVFQDRLDVAVAHMEADSLDYDPMPRSMELNDVRLKDFVKWAIDRGWTVPPELERLAPPDGDVGTNQPVDTPTDAPGENDPHPRTRNNFLRLIYALAMTIPDFTPQKPYAAADAIIAHTRVKLDRRTISGYITDAYELAQRDRDDEEV